MFDWLLLGKSEAVSSVERGVLRSFVDYMKWLVWKRHMWFSKEGESYA